MPALGLDTIDHVVPFHAITNVAVGLPKLLPTATQSDALAHDTDISSSWVPPLGLDTVDHAVPFHAITNVEGSSLPTATHDDAEIHDTELSLWLFSSPTPGLDITDHDDPSQDITNGSPWPL